MSRIGRAPIAVPAGVTVTVGEENLITVKGAKGELTYKAPASMTVTVDGATVHVTRPDDENENRALHGLTRTLIHNMVEGVSKGYEKKLEIAGLQHDHREELRQAVLRSDRCEHSREETSGTVPRQGYQVQRRAYPS